MTPLEMVDESGFGNLMCPWHVGHSTVWPSNSSGISKGCRQCGQKILVSIFILCFVKRVSFFWLRSRPETLKAWPMFVSHTRISLPINGLEIGTRHVPRHTAHPLIPLVYIGFPLWMTNSYGAKTSWWAIKFNSAVSITVYWALLQGDWRRSHCVIISDTENTCLYYLFSLVWAVKEVQWYEKPSF